MAAALRLPPLYSALMAAEEPEATPVPGRESAPLFISTAEAAKLLGIHRSTLDAMLVRAPATLPGGPLNVAGPGKRKSWRWERATLRTWIDAYRAWEAEREAPPEQRRASLPPAPPKRKRSRGVVARAEPEKQRPRQRRSLLKILVDEEEDP